MSPSLVRCSVWRGELISTLMMALRQPSWFCGTGRRRPRLSLLVVPRSWRTKSTNKSSSLVGIETRVTAILSRSVASRRGRAGARRKASSNTMSAAEKPYSVCPPYKQQGQGDKVVGSNFSVPWVLHRDGMTTRGYLAAFTAVIDSTTLEPAGTDASQRHALQRRCVRLSRRDLLSLASLGDHSGDGNLENMQASRVGQLGRK